MTGDATQLGVGPKVIAHVRIGCGLAGGDWTAIELILETLIAAGVDTTVHDLA